MKLNEFAAFWRNEVRTLDCPTYPTKPSDLPIHARMLLEQYQNGQLYQEMFGEPSRLPADVLVRYNAGENIPQDESKLIDAGLTQAARAARVRGEKLADAAMQKTYEEGRKSYLEQRKRAQQWNDADFGQRIAMSQPLSPEVIARNRKELGYTGKADWEIAANKGQD